MDYLPSQHPDIARRFPEITQANYGRAVQLIDEDGSVYSGAEAVFRTLAANPTWGWPLHAYQNIPAVAAITDASYDFVASHRPAFSRLTRWFWGRHVERPEHVVTRWFFLRALGIVYFFAFLSLAMQVQGLIGPDGILPADRFLSAVKEGCDAQGIGVARFGLVPTLLRWLGNASERLL